MYGVLHLILSVLKRGHIHAEFLWRRLILRAIVHIGPFFRQGVPDDLQDQL